MFDDTDPSMRRPKPRVYYWDAPDDDAHDFYEEDAAAYWMTWPGHESYWAAGDEDWGDLGWDEAWHEDEPSWYEEGYVAEADQGELPEEEASLVSQEQEASVLAAEANWTLASRSARRHSLLPFELSASRNDILGILMTL